MIAALSGVLIALELALFEPPGLRHPPPPIAACRADEPDQLRRMLGRRLIVRMEGEATPALLRQARRGEIGGVILFPPAGQDPTALRDEITQLQRAASEASEVPLVVAIDQEGGEVKRLPALPPDRPPARIAAVGRERLAREQGLATGRALVRLGIVVDLAPVLDVPAAPDSFLGSRAFGADPETAASIGVAFAEGLAAGSARATAKHFPGLGRSTANTDLGPSEIAAGPGELEADLLPFERAIDAGVPLVMLSSATYPELDPAAPAFASPQIAERLLRDRLGFDGVTITDDLGAGAVRSRYGLDEAAVAAARGGSDLLLFAQTSTPRVLGPLVRATERGTLDPDALEASCVRILALEGGVPA